MLRGSEEVYYTPVEAYAVSTFADSIGSISGGTGGDAIVTNGVRFLWSYYNNSPNGAPSGFTDSGWYSNIEGSPIWYSVNYCSVDFNDILEGLGNGTIQNLNEIFQNWQQYVRDEAAKDNDVVKSFMYQIPPTCWSTLQS